MSLTPTDYFMTKGYKKLVLRLLMQTCADLQIVPTSNRQKLIIAEAQAWVSDRTPSTDMNSGLTFADCIYALGEASEVDKYRDAVLDRPKVIQQQVAATLDAMNADESVFADRPPIHEGSKTSGFDTSWLYPSMSAGQY